jgi:hypothetical protein
LAPVANVDTVYTTLASLVNGSLLAFVREAPFQY